MSTCIKLYAYSVTVDTLSLSTHSEMEVDIGKLTENFLTTCSQYVPGQSQPKLLYSLVIRCLEVSFVALHIHGLDALTVCGYTLNRTPLTKPNL